VDKPADSGPTSNVEVLQPFTINLRERLDELPWRTGSYLVDVIFGNELSNRAKFDLAPGEAAEKDPAIAEYIAKQKAAWNGPKDLLPRHSANSLYPNYRKTETSLPIPTSKGILLAPERVSVYRPGAHSILRGSFRLIVPAAFYSHNDLAKTPDLPTAVVPITLVITGNLMTGPFVIPLRVATYDPVNPVASEMNATGQFEINFFDLPATSKVPQTYTIWAYSGDVRSDPATAAIISPDMLR
jgi:hypothetical protein